MFLKWLTTTNINQLLLFCALFSYEVEQVADRSELHYNSTEAMWIWYERALMFSEIYATHLCLRCANSQVLRKHVFIYIHHVHVHHKLEWKLLFINLLKNIYSCNSNLYVWDKVESKSLRQTDWPSNVHSSAFSFADLIEIQLNRRRTHTPMSVFRDVSRGWFEFSLMKKRRCLAVKSAAGRVSSDPGC